MFRPWERANGEYVPLETARFLMFPKDRKNAFANT